MTVVCMPKNQNTKTSKQVDVECCFRSFSQMVKYEEKKKDT